MTNLGERLERLGLSQYLEVFVTEGFDTWEIVLDITESDLSALNVKLGHRRKLQRAIAETRGQAAERALAHRRVSSIDGSYRSDDSASDGKAINKDGVGIVKSGSTTTKRKYRRHPKPDEHAPERPPSAYVLFSNHVRETLKGQALSFTEIAKIVGERWQVLSHSEKDMFERRAAGAKEKYYAELGEYKKTPEYAQYQNYLVEFKAKHAAAHEGKRSKLETEASVTSTSLARSNSQETAEKPFKKRASGPFVEGYSFGQQRSGSSPPSSAAYSFPTGFVPSTKATSPEHNSRSGMSSPKGERYSPVSVSPGSTVLSRDLPPAASHYIGPSLTLEPRDPTVYAPYSHPSPLTPVLHSPIAPSYPNSLNNTVTPHYSLLYRGRTDLPPRRAVRDTASLPPLVHEDTSLSSDASLSGVPYQTPGMPDVDASKALRTLPRPVPTLGAAPSLLEQRQASDLQNGASWPALLKATELARDADREAGDNDPT